ncbi:hypothetical protein SBOR_6858 [Sclerotinia borealis F-4128]|uniref:Rhodopsin domain-containing protein n=1 Tax=Sclerotinia borealis (strain F-4128) TaxID=1432307 RepID=W9CA73_SCLBF|nr:hypothetical protein SBOR_6858 [Sclerotinia borealis F-4128]
MVMEAPEKQNEILIITLIFFIIACVAVALRCYVRIRLLNAFGSDDALAVCSLLFLCVGTIFTLIGLSSGFGQHDSGMALEHFIKGLKYWCFSEIIYPPTIAVIKSSIALYLIRIAVNPYHIYTIYISMSLFLIYSAAFFVLLLLQCTPITFYWWRFTGATDGHCLVPTTIAAVAYGHAALSVLTDLTLGIIPAFIVADLQITTRTKTAVAMTLALGSINVITLSIVEAAVGLTASCLATLKPLVRSFLDWSENSIGSSGALHTRMIDGISGRKRTRIDDTELHLRPDLKIVGFTTTIISSNGRESPPPRHSSLNQTVGDKNEPWYSPHGCPKSHERLGSRSGIIEAAEPAYDME